MGFDTIGIYLVFSYFQSCHFLSWCWCCSCHCLCCSCYCFAVSWNITKIQTVIPFGQFLTNFKNSNPYFTIRKRGLRTCMAYACTCFALKTPLLFIKSKIYQKNAKFNLSLLTISKSKKQEKYFQYIYSIRYCPALTYYLQV